MTQHRIGIDALALPPLRHRIRHHEERRLRVLRPFQHLCSLLPLLRRCKQQRAQIQPQQRLQFLAATVHLLPEHRFPFVQRLPHAGVLRSLPRKHESHARPLRQHPALDVTPRVPARHRPLHFLMVRSQHHRTVRKPAPSNPQRKGGIPQRHLRVRRHKGPKLLRRCPQGRLRPGREHQRIRSALLLRLRCLFHLQLRCLLQHHVHVGTPYSE